jgi:hypothetical protein
MRLLLAHGADPKLVSDFGDTGADAAAGIGWVEGVGQSVPPENVEAVVVAGSRPDLNSPTEMVARR